MANAFVLMCAELLGRRCRRPTRMCGRLGYPDIVQVVKAGFHTPDDYQALGAVFLPIGLAAAVEAEQPFAPTAARQRRRC